MRREITLFGALVLFAAISIVAPASADIGLDCGPPGDARCETWTARRNHGAYDSVHASAASASGDRVFIAGMDGFSGSAANDISTIGLDGSTGAFLWERSYAGPGNKQDIPSAISVSPADGTVAVAGTKGAASGNPDSADFVVLAYDTATGATRWTKLYDSGGYDFAMDLAWSPDGASLYVTGISRGSSSSPWDFDHLTVALDATTGSIEWVTRNSSSSGGYDYSLAVAVSPDGATVATTGWWQIDGSVGGYGTIAYDAATGATRWVRTQDSGTDTGNSGWEVAFSPDSSRIHVAGRTQRPGGSTFHPGTIAYDAATGATLWSDHALDYSIAAEIPSMGVNPVDGTVYTTSGAIVPKATGGGFDILVLAYDGASGVRRWVYLYDIPTQSQFLPAIAVPAAGTTVAIAGITQYDGNTNAITTLSLDAATGALRWDALYGPPLNAAWANPIKPTISSGGGRVFVGKSVGISTSHHVERDHFVAAYDEASTDPDPTPSPTPSASATPEPTPTESVSPSPSPTPTTTLTPSPSEPPSVERGTYPQSPDDPYFGVDPTGSTDFRPTQWAPRKIQVPQAWQEPRATGFGIRVAVLDTGVDLQHEDLKCPGKLDVGPGSDVVNNDSDPDDQNGHGTHVAGIIGACTNNGTGIAGVAPDATIVPVRVLNAAGSGTDAQLIAGLDKATELGVHVINMSLGYPPGKNIINDVSAIDAAIARAQEAGIVLVAAAGNDSFPLCEYPALAEDIICVGATDPRDLKSWYSTFPNKTDSEDTIGPSVVAPGGTEPVFCDLHAESILSLYPVELDSCNEVPRLDGYRDLNGTSMAAPHVSGIAALVYDRLGAGRNATNAQAVINTIVGNTDDLGAPGYDPVFGFGRVNALKAVQAVTPEPDPTSSPTPGESGTPDPTPTETASSTPTDSPSPSPSESPEPETATVIFTERSAESSQYSDEALFEARLTDSNGAPLEGRELPFDLIGAESSRSFSATTDEDGIASVSPTLEENPGPYQLTVRFDGDENHAGDADTMSFVVDKEDADVALTVEGRGQNMTLTARLSDLDTPSDGIADRTIDFYSDAELIGSEVTDSDGVATVAVPPSHRGANRTYEAVFDGDDFYLGSSDERAGKGKGGNGGGNGGGGTEASYAGKMLLM